MSPSGPIALAVGPQHTTPGASVATTCKQPIERVVASTSGGPGRRRRNASLQHALQHGRRLAACCRATERRQSARTDATTTSAGKRGTGCSAAHSPAMAACRASGSRNLATRLAASRTSSMAAPLAARRAAQCPSARGSAPPAGPARRRAHAERRPAQWLRGVKACSSIACSTASVTVATSPEAGSCTCPCADTGSTNTAAPVPHNAHCTPPVGRRRISRRSQVRPAGSAMHPWAGDQRCARSQIEPTSPPRLCVAPPRAPAARSTNAQVRRSARSHSDSGCGCWSTLPHAVRLRDLFHTTVPLKSRA